jgi:hypothetical protein
VAPGFDQPYLNLANLYIQINQKGKAQAILRALLGQHPDHALAKKELDALSRQVRPVRQSDEARRFPSHGSENCVV